MIRNKQWYTAITSSFKFILSIKGEKKTLAKYILYDLRFLIRKNYFINLDNYEEKNQVS